MTMVGSKKSSKSPARPKPQAAKLTVAEFFAGIGLVRLALERHSWKVLFANDIDPDKQEMYEKWFGADHFFLGDIHKLEAADIPDVTLFTASFPCNDLSVAGEMAGLSGKESGAFFGLIRLLEDKGDRKPPIVMLENVVGFLMSNSGKDLETALTKLNELGYVCDVFIINASRFVPQSRPRLFVIARLDSEEPRECVADVSEIRPEPLVKFINSHQAIRWDIQKLPPLPLPNHRLEEIIEDLPADDAHWWDCARAEYFFNQLSDRHVLVAKKMMAGKKISYGTAFRRVRKGRSMAELRTDGIAGCLRTPKGGSGRQIVFKAGKGKYQVRLMTARECGRLQGLPDDFPLDGVPLNQALFGFGDAVCVPVVEWIAKHYLTPMAMKMIPVGKLESQLFVQ